MTPQPRDAIQRQPPYPGHHSTPFLFHDQLYMKNQPKPTESNPPPAHKIRHGAVSASIWRQETDKGVMFNVTFQRSYKEGEEWKSSSSFGRNNLLVLSLIAARAFEWIGNQQTESPTR